MVWLGVLWQLAAALGDLSPVGLVAGAAGLLLVAVLVARLPRHPAQRGTGPRLTRAALRETTRRTGVPRHRDPDAAGRSRPRAPTARPAAA